MNNDEANNESCTEETLKQLFSLTIDLYVNQKKSKQEVISILQGIGKGLIFIIIGALITAVTYSMAEGGGTYVVTVGLFICGGLLILKSLIYLISNLLKTVRYM